MQCKTVQLYDTKGQGSSSGTVTIWPAPTKTNTLYHAALVRCVEIFDDQRVLPRPLRPETTGLKKQNWPAGNGFSWEVHPEATPWDESQDHRTDVRKMVRAQDEGDTTCLQADLPMVKSSKD